MNTYYLKTEASVKTFLKQIYTGKKNTDKMRIYKRLRKTPNLNFSQLSGYTKLPIQTISARVSGLMDMGIVEVSYTLPKIASGSSSFDSYFRIQENEAKIKANQIQRRKLRFERLQNQIKGFDDILPKSVINKITKIDYALV